MLVLTRKKNETIVIDDNIEVEVLEIRQNSVRLGITAPGDVKIYRREIWVEIQEAAEGSVNHG